MSFCVFSALMSGFSTSCCNWSQALAASLKSMAAFAAVEVMNPATFLLNVMALIACLLCPAH
jgi:hypothetical protein